MENSIKGLIDDYIEWLRSTIVLNQIEEWIEITTPYLDRHNDYLQIYVKKENDNEFLLTDDGYIIQDLESSGCSLDSEKRWELLQLTLNGFGVKLKNKSLFSIATKENFKNKKHNLLQAMLAVNDLFYLARPFVSSLFLEDVIKWFDENEVRYVPNVKFTGASGYDHFYDFAIPKSRENPERYVRAINRPDRNNAESFAWSWIDTRESRTEGSRAVAILNDIEHSVSPSIFEAFSSYDIDSVLWSERSNFTPMFVN